MQQDRRTLTGTLTVVLIFVFGFYFYSFIAKPEGDATVRVGLILVSSLATAALAFLPEPPQPSS